MGALQSSDGHVELMQNAGALAAAQTVQKIILSIEYIKMPETEENHAE